MAQVTLGWKNCKGRQGPEMEAQGYTSHTSWNP